MSQNLLTPSEQEHQEYHDKISIKWHKTIKEPSMFIEYLLNETGPPSKAVKICTNTIIEATDEAEGDVADQILSK